MIIEISYRINGNKCYVSCDDEAFISTVCDLCKGFDVTSIQRNEQSHFTHIYVTQTRDDQYQIINNNICEKLNTASALGYVIRTVLDSLTQENENAYFIHGACVQYSGKYSCFIGRTKSGKSTLAYLLCKKADCKYATDDLVCIDRSLNCMPFAKPIFLRNTNYIDEVDSYVKIQNQNDLRYCVLPTNIIDKEKRFQIDNVFIIERDPICSFWAEKLSSTSAFVNIWKNMYTSEFLIPKRNTSLLLAQRATVYMLKYRDVSCDMRNLFELME